MSYYSQIKKSPRVYMRPKEFLEDAVGYFKWCEDNPLLEGQMWIYKGEVIRAKHKKVRAFTLKGLATHLSMSVNKLNGLRVKSEGWANALEMVEQIIYTQKFENAAAGLLNATIISRDLGLAEKSEVSGITGAPPITFTITPVAAGTFLPEAN